MSNHDFILLVLDPAPLLDLMERALRAAGYEVAIVHDKEELDKAVAETNPALVMVG